MELFQQNKQRTCISCEIWEQEHMVDLCSLSCNGNGATCVLKFSSNKDTDEARNLLKQEAEIWTKAWKLPVDVKDWCGEPALMMPFVLPIQENQWTDKFVQEAVKNAVIQLAEAGYKHDDTHRRHVGLYKDGIHLKAVLFDLGKMVSISNSSDETTAAITFMLNSLKLDASIMVHCSKK